MSKIIRALLCLSLFGNLVLGLRLTQSALKATGHKTTHLETEGEILAADSRPSPSHHAEFDLRPTRLQLRGSMQELVSYLQQQGLRRSVVEDAVRRVVSEENKEKRLNIEYPAGELTHSASVNTLNNDAIVEQSAEEKRTIRAALGEDWIAVDSPLQEADYQNRFSGILSRDQYSKITKIREDYYELRIASAASPDRRIFDLIDQQERADIESLLSPAQLVEFDLRESPVARAVAMEFDGVPLNESEYRRLVDKKILGDIPVDFIRELLGEERLRQVLEMRAGSSARGGRNFTPLRFYR